MAVSVKFCPCMRHVFSKYQLIQRHSRLTSLANNRLYSSVKSEEKDEIDRVRDVSRLPARMRNRTSDRLILTDETKNVMRKSLRAKLINHRRLYAKYGKESGINPGIMWPSIQEMEYMVEDEKEWDKTLQDMVAVLNAKKRAKAEEIEKREELIDEKMKQMPKHIDRFRQKLKEAKEKELFWQEKQRVMLEEAREFYGYELHPRDVQYQAFVESKQEEERQAKKKLKKAKRAEKLLQMVKEGEEKTDAAVENKQ